jgi:hypothetical protein
MEEQTAKTENTAASSKRREPAREPMTQIGLSPTPVSPAIEEKKNPPARDQFDYDIPLSDKPGLQGYLELISRVRSRIQEGLDRNLALRRSMFW